MVNGVILEGIHVKERMHEHTVATFKDIMSESKHRRNLIALIAIWVTTSFNYYLITFQLKYIEGDVYINTLVSSLSDLPARLLCAMVYKSIGLTRTFTLAFVISLIGGLALLLVHHPSLIPIFILLAKSGVSASFNICYLANA